VFLGRNVKTPTEYVLENIQVTRKVGAPPKFGIKPGSKGFHAQNKATTYTMTPAGAEQRERREQEIVARSVVDPDFANCWYEFLGPVPMHHNRANVHTLSLNPGLSSESP
jgi:hypothetical protein